MNVLTTGELSNAYHKVKGKVKEFSSLAIVVKLD